MRRESVLSCDAADEIILYDRQSDVAVSLNLTAAAIWELCDGTNSVEDLVAELAEAVDGESHTLAAEVERVLHDLHSLDLLDMRPAAQADSHRGV